MKKIAFICPYFGKLPSHFQLWLNSCWYNQDITWILFLDDKTLYNYPDNVQVYQWSWSEMIEHIQNRFDFKIMLKTPYKLCDFKPIYGYIFEEYLVDYDFWGHCDISDCIFGKLSHFLTDDIFENYDKILFLGHMTIYRNTKKVRDRFKLTTKSGKGYQHILQSEKNCAFDELNESSINTIYQENNYPIKIIDSMYADISPIHYSFRLSCYNNKFEQYYEKTRPRIFTWEHGRLFGLQIKENKIEKQEYGYIHFQKREMSIVNIQIETDREFLIVPNRFLGYKGEINKDVIRKFTKRKLFYKVFWQQKWKALLWHINRLLK